LSRVVQLLTVPSANADTILCTFISNLILEHRLRRRLGRLSHNS
jgi:hypothetical protein